MGRKVLLFGATGEIGGRIATDCVDERWGYTHTSSPFKKTLTLRVFIMEDKND
jgi:hypothetical protein